MDDQDQKIDEVPDEYPPEEISRRLSQRLCEAEGRELKLFALLAELDQIIEGYRPGERSPDEVRKDMTVALLATKEAYGL